jgi:DNA-directed RNA polymerase II subunit RPB1
VNDLKLGTSDKKLNCETCGSNFVDCPGHFGHITLTRPVFHVGFIEVIKKILKCICFNCSKLLLPKGTKYKEILKIKNPKKRQISMVHSCKSIFQCKLSEKKDEVN